MNGQSETRLQELLKEYVNINTALERWQLETFGPSRRSEYDLDGNQGSDGGGVVFEPRGTTGSHPRYCPTCGISNNGTGLPVAANCDICGGLLVSVLVDEKLRMEFELKTSDPDTKH